MFFFQRKYLKKCPNRPTGRARPGLLQASAFISRRPTPGRNPSRRPPRASRPRRCRLSPPRPRHRRPAPPTPPPRRSRRRRARRRRLSRRRRRPAPLRRRLTAATLPEVAAIAGGFLFLDPLFLLEWFLLRFSYLASVRSFVRFNECARRLDPDNERSFVKLFVVILFLGLNPQFF